MFQYILLNSIFNCFECFLSTFAVLSECLAQYSIFCPSISKLLVVQYFRVFVVGYLGEVLKTCSILTSIGFSFERYYQASRSTNTLFKRLSNMSIRQVCMVVIVFASLTSIAKIYEYRISAGVPSNSDYPSRFHINYTNPFNVWHLMYFLHYILNDFVLLLLNLFIDFCLILIIKKDLKVKLKNRKNLGFSKTSSPAQALQEAKTIEAQKKTDKLIIFSAIVYVLTRLPELLATIFFYFFLLNYAHEFIKCSTSVFCYFFSNLIEYLYMISYSTNIYFYYKFNRSFEKNFKIFFHLKADH